jgi:hypothetical protein
VSDQENTNEDPFRGFISYSEKEEAPKEEAQAAAAEDEEVSLSEDEEIEGDTPVDEAEAEAEDDEAGDDEAEAEAGDDEAEAEAGDDEAEAEDPDDDEVEDDADDEKPRKKKKKSVQQRINEVTRERRTAEREAARLQKELEEARQRLLTYQDPADTSGEQPAKEDAPAAPNPEDFEYGEIDSRYISALAHHEATLVVAKMRKEEEQKRQVEADAVKQQEQRQKTETLYRLGLQKYDDFEDVVVEGARNEEWPLTATVGELMINSDCGADIAYYLATNKQEAVKLAQQSDVMQAKMFGRLEERFSSKPDAPKKPKASKAPKPPSATAKGTGGKQKVKPNTSDFGAFYQYAIKELNGG